MAAPVLSLIYVGVSSSAVAAATLAQESSTDVVQIVNEWGVAGVVMAVAYYLLRENRREGDQREARHDSAFEVIERKHATAIAAMAEIHEAEVKRLRDDVESRDARIDFLIEQLQQSHPKGIPS